MFMFTRTKFSSAKVMPLIFTINFAFDTSWQCYHQVTCDLHIHHHVYVDTDIETQNEWQRARTPVSAHVCWPFLRSESSAVRTLHSQFCASFSVKTLGTRTRPYVYITRLCNNVNRQLYHIRAKKSRMVAFQLTHCQNSLTVCDLVAQLRCGHPVPAE